MGLIELLFTACSILHPTECREVNFQFIDQGGSLAQCMQQAPPYMARWASEHEDLRVVRWRCAYPESRERDL